MKAFFVLRQCLDNYKQYSFGKRRIEKGDEKKGEFDIPEAYGGNLKVAGQKGGPPVKEDKKKEEKKAPPKQAQGKPGEKGGAV